MKAMEAGALFLVDPFPGTYCHDWGSAFFPFPPNLQSSVYIQGEIPTVSLTQEDCMCQALEADVLCAIGLLAWGWG